MVSEFGSFYSSVMHACMILTAENKIIFYILHDWVSPFIAPFAAVLTSRAGSTTRSDIPMHLYLRRPKQTRLLIHIYLFINLLQVFKYTRSAALNTFVYHKLLDRAELKLCWQPGYVLYSGRASSCQRTGCRHEPLR